jgi:hypothetical protein
VRLGWRGGGECRSGRFQRPISQYVFDESCKNGVTEGNEGYEEDEDNNGWVLQERWWQKYNHMSLFFFMFCSIIVVVKAWIWIQK